MWWVIHHSICSRKRSSSCWSVWYLLPDSHVKSISQAKNQWSWHTKPILFEKIFVSAMCIKFMSVISYIGTQVHIVRSCCDRLQWTLGTRHTDRHDMQFKVVSLVALITVNIIWIISIYLAQIWAVSQWLSFRTSDLNARYLYCLCEQTAKVDRSHYIISLSHHKSIRNFNLFQPFKFSIFSDRLYTCIVNNFYTDTQNNLCIIW